MLRYWWVIMAGAVFGLCSCQWSETKETVATYPIQGITAYQGQDVSSLMNDNGAPNDVQNMPDGSVVWIYYTNYRPLGGGGEIISYDMPTNAQAQNTCTVQVTIQNDTVVQVIENNC